MPYVPEKNIVINSITIGKRTGQTIELMSGQESFGSSISFDMLTINEDINEPFLSGSIALTDSNNLLEQLNIRAGDPIQLDLSFINPIDDKGGTERANKNLTFNIIDIINMTDPANQKVQGSSGTPVKLLIRFGTQALSYLNFMYYLEEDLIGPISNEYSEEDPYKGKSENTSIKEILDQITPKCTKKRNELEKRDEYIIGTEGSNIAGWPENSRSIMSIVVDYINRQSYSKTFKNLVSHASFNDAWLKPYNNYYPAFKTSKSPYLINIINYIKENTVLKVTESKDLLEAEPTKLPKRPVVDFMFWEDLDQYNFKSISKIVKNAEEKNTIGLYYLDSDTNDMGSVASMEVLTDYQLPTLLAQGAYASEYVHVKPNWKSPFRNALSANEEFIKTLVRYSYTSDVWKSDQQKTKNNPVIAAEISESPTPAGYPLFDNGDMAWAEFPNSNVSLGLGIVDNNFGYFDTTIYHSNKPTIWWEFIHDGVFKFDIKNTENSLSNPQRDARLFSAPSEDTDDEGNPLPTILKYPGITHHGGRYETERWQAHYDLCELPGSVLYKINYGIKWDKDLLANRSLYGETKELKEKWKFFKESICCERKVPENFFALITKAEKIWGSGATGLEAATPSTIDASFEKDQSGIYAYNWVEVEFWPRSDVSMILQNGEDIIKFENHEMYPFVFVRPRGALEGHGILKRKYWARQDDSEDPNYQNLNGVTGLNRSEWKDKEFFTKDLRAFNLNEILNTVGITLGGYPESTFAGLPVNAFKECSTLISNPGISTKGHKISAAGATDTCTTTYPSSFKMMPVGHFRIIGKCTTEKTKEDWGFGRIVQMHAIPKDIMQTFGKVQDGIGLTLPVASTPALPYDSTRKSKNEKIKVKTKDGEKEISLESRTEIVERLKEADAAGDGGGGGDGGEPPPVPLVDTKLVPEHQFLHQSPYMFIFDVENAHDGLCDGSCPI